MKPNKSLKSPLPMPYSSSSAVTFIPAMIDGSCGTSPVMHRYTPMQMMLNDMRIMAQNMRCLPEMMGSMMSLGMMQSTLGSWRNLRDMCLQVILTVMEMWMVVMMLPAFLAMPGLAFAVWCCICTMTIATLSWPLKGDQVIRCTSKGQQSDQHADERWVYINGAMTR